MAPVTVHGDLQAANANARMPVLEVVAPYAVTGDQTTPRLVWVLPFAGMREGIDIDALTGDPIRAAPKG